ncbi:MAG: CvpA family protein [Phycisphaerales bacterium]|nr:CvpA family protein [Phycisphaerales bacterium]
MILNVAVIVLVLFIAYWWANQGLFSAILHCLCVIAAGALALAFWEPIVVGFFLNGNDFDNYAWGMTLGGLFIAFLFILRLVCDHFAPSNVRFTPAVNLFGGGIFGLLAGVLTAGITCISCGLIQAPVEIMGYVGWARAADAGGAPMQLNKMMLPAADFTEKFYATLSRGSLSPFRATPLADYYPRLADTALSLHRDSFSDGEGRVALAPDSVTLGDVLFDPSYSAADGSSSGTYAVAFTIDSGAFDAGEQFIISSAQVRITSDEKTPKLAFPTKFYQPMSDGTSKLYPFDDISNFATSVPGEQDVKLMFLFPADGFPAGKQPKFVFVKGLRFVLPATTEVSDLEQRLNGEEEDAVEQDDSAPDGGFVDDISNLIAVKNSILPVQMNTNMASPMTHVIGRSGNFLSGGKGIYRKGAAMSISRSQRIGGFSHAEGTEVILLDVSRRKGGLDLYGDGSAAIKALGRDIPLELVDSRSKGYKPTGYIWERQNDVEINYEPGKPIQKLSQLPSQPSSGENKLKLIFVVPVGTNITGVRLGKTMIGRCNVTAKDGGVD